MLSVCVLVLCAVVFDITFLAIHCCARACSIVCRLSRTWSNIVETWFLSDQSSLMGNPTPQRDLIIDRDERDSCCSKATQDQMWCCATVGPQ